MIRNTGLTKVCLLTTALTACATSCHAADHSVNISALRGFLNTHCRDCHDAASREAGLDIFALPTDLSDDAALAKWIRIHDRVAQGEMPPPESDQPASGERLRFKQQLALSLTAGHMAEKGTVLRRLNRQEYENTLNDLFGTNLKLVAMLPEDGRSGEFDNVGESLSISMVQMQRYLEAIETVLDAAIAKTVRKPESTVTSASYANGREAQRFLGKQWLKLDDGAVVFFRRLGYPTGMLREASVRKSGFYRIRVTGYAHQSSKPITFSIGSTTFARGAEKPTYGYYSMPPGKPTTVGITAWMQDRYMVQIEPYGITDRYEIKNNGIENYKGPGLAILNVELEGPLTEEFPSRGHRLIFDGLSRQEKEPANPAIKKKPWYQPEFEVTADNPSAAVRSVLKRVASAAFRRPADKTVTEPYAKLFDSELDAGATFEEALRTAISAMFCSPDFLFLRENSGRLDDYALASRLSYFLNRTTPDERLLTAARNGQLTGNRTVFRNQVERLLDHPHARRFITDFTDSWLNLRDIDFTVPDRVLFPEFDPFLKHSITKETRQFFSELITKNLSVRNIVKSDFAMLNSRLAEHYEIEGVSDPEIRRVPLPPDSIRGGFLTQASVLKVSANGTNTSPVVRGVWVMERILGQTPPPPPPGISGVEPDIRGASTLRELLDRHRDSDTCRNCHQMIDPPGFALECFSPVGGYRDRFRSLGEGERINLEIDGRKVRYKLGPPVDASGQLQDGSRFGGFREFRDLLALDEDHLANAFTTKLLTFATGREMGFSDRAEIDEITAASRSGGHGIRGLIHLVLQSRIFRSK